MPHPGHYQEVKIFIVLDQLIHDPVSRLRRHILIGLANDQQKGAP